MQNFGTITDNFDAVTKQYVDDKASAKRIRSIKVENADVADTANKVKNAFTYKVHDKAAGTVLPITYDGRHAASLDFSENDFTYDYNSFNDIKIKLAEDVKTSLRKADTALQNVPSYNDLPNIPVINQDLSATDFTPVANTYYKHTGTTTASYTNGVIYYYNGTGYAALDGSGGGSTAVTEQVTVAADDWMLDGIIYKQAPTNPIVAGDVLTTLYVDNTKTPDFTAFDWSGATADDMGFQQLTIIDGSKDVKINKYPQGTEIDENTTLTTDQYEIAISGDAVLYMTDEWAVANGLTTGGWVFSGSVTIQSNTVVEPYQQDIWGEYISKDGQWQQVPVGSSTIPPFAYRATKTIGTEMGVNSVVSLGYSDSASMRECASAGVAIGEVPTVSGNVITFYSVTKPTQAVNLVVEISETTTNA